MANIIYAPVLTYKPEFQSSERKVKTGRFIIFCGEKYVGEVTSEALAKLICSAPKLLNALRIFVAAESAWADLRGGMPEGTFDDPLGDAFTQAQSAISEAEVQ